MKCTTYIENENLVLCVEEIASNTVEETVKAAFFHKEDEKYVKKYPSNVPECSLIQNNFPAIQHRQGGL